MGEDDLAASLVGLSGLLTGARPLREVLTEVAGFAVAAVPGADGAALTAHGQGRARTAVATAAVVEAAEEVQRALGEGPSVTAVTTGLTQTCGSLGGDPRWPRFGPRAGRMGLHSALSLPLLLGREVVGALDVYARAKDAFGEDAVRTGEAFARPAAVSVHNARVLDGSQRLTAQLEAVLGSRAVVDQALGVIMSRTGADAEEAFARLRTMSQTQHAKVVDVARVLVEEAVRRARARTPDAR